MVIDIMLDMVLDNLLYKGEELKADLILFGHTHVPHYIGRIWYNNNESW